MKKILLALTLVGSLAVCAQQQPPPPPAKVKFYYYPSSNIYYNPATNEYWYYDNPTVTWMEVRELPPTITFTKTPKYTVYYNGQDVWKDNATHKKKYKAKDNGTTKTKQKPKS